MRDGETPDDRSLQRFHEAFDEVMRGLARLPTATAADPPPPATDQTVHHAEVGDQLNDLITYLESDIYEARKRFDELYPRFGVLGVRDEAEALKRALADYDTDRALELGQTILSLLSHASTTDLAPGK